jgi:hypothetical protein
MTYPMTDANARRTRSATNGMAVAGLVCGIVGLFVFAIVLGPLAIVFGAVGIARARAGAAGRTMATWAIGLGVVDLVLWIVLFIAASRNGTLY